MRPSATVGTKSPNRSALRSLQGPRSWQNGSNVTIDRQVRFTEEFFERLDVLLPEERGTDGTPSVTDFLVFEVPPIRDRLASRCTRNHNGDSKSVGPSQRDGRCAHQPDRCVRARRPLRRSRCSTLTSICPSIDKASPRSMTVLVGWTIRSMLGSWKSASSSVLRAWTA